MPEIKLNKKNKTIKVVNRKQNIRLKHGGKPGPKGDKGDPGNGTADLGNNPSPTGIEVTSSTGANTDLPLADGTNAGLMSPADKTKLDSITGSATSANGTATILNGSTSVTVNHGVTGGTIEEIHPTNLNLTQQWSVQNHTATSFDVVVLRSPGLNGASFYWKVVG